MPTKLQEAQHELEAKRKALGDIFASKPDLSFSEDEVKDIRSKNEELTDLGKKYDVLREVEEIAVKTKGDQERLSRLQQPVPFQTGQPPIEGQFDGRIWQPAMERKSLGQQFVEAEGYKHGQRKGSPQVHVNLEDVHFKTTLTEAVGYAPPNYRTNIVIPSAQRRPLVADLIPQTVTALQIINYMRETTFTNNAAYTAEGALKPESALAYTQISSPVEKVATFLPVTEEVLDDVPSIEALINDRLTLMVMLSEEVGLLNGNGTAPQLTGFLNTSGIQTQAKGTDATPDSVYKAMTLIRSIVGFADPSGIIWNPLDWENVKLLRTTTGQYLWGNPSEMGPDRIWGLPIVQTIAMTQGTALVGDFRMYSHISRRMGFRIDVSNSHSDFFQRNLLAIRGETRLSLEVYRPSAFCTITGL